MARRKKLDTAILELAADCEVTPVVRRLCCLRGISTLTALGLAVEIGDWERFTGATIGAFCGLAPSENSAGEAVGGKPQPGEHPKIASTDGCGTTCSRCRVKTDPVLPK